MYINTRHLGLQPVINNRNMYHIIFYYLEL